MVQIASVVETVEVERQAAANRMLTAMITVNLNSIYTPQLFAQV